MNALLIYPEYPDTFWSWKRIMKIIRKKAAFPPLGLLTIAAMMPKEWQKKLVDMNVSDLKDKDLKWADYVFISAMITQSESAKQVISRCNKLGIKVVVGGPLFTTSFEGFEGIDHVIVGEAEDIFPIFLDDLAKGCAKKVYSSEVRPDITKAVIPMWSLINPKDYVSLSVQNSRGCPHGCEFCDIIIMNGRIPRVKSPDQFLAEINAIYETGFSGMVLVVDDNFIGNRAKTRLVLPKLAEWQKSKGNPFSFSTEASIELSDDEQLMNMMVAAGFDQVFLGLETPSPKGLAECGKRQNQNRDVVACIKKIQQHGMHTSGGFIIGLDSDTDSIFDEQIKFVQESGVVVAMVGLLMALPKTKLYERLQKEGRILRACTGNNTDLLLNFITKMDKEVLLGGYKRVIRTIYSPKKYYERICTFLKEYKPLGKKGKRMDWVNIKAFFMSIWHIGLTGRWINKWYYWKTLFMAAIKYRRAFPEAVAMQIWGLHLREIADSICES